MVDDPKTAKARAAQSEPPTDRLRAETKGGRCHHMITYRDLAMLAPASPAFNRPEWIFELKHDGFRVLAGRTAKDPFLSSRRGTDLLPCYPEIRACLVELPQMVLDGELVVLDRHGRPDFESLRRRLAMKRPIAVEHAAKTMPAAIFAFDLLELRGKDVRTLPLLKRKQLLGEELRGSERIRYLEHVGESGHRLFQVAEELGLEGIIAKHAGAPYRRGRASGWIKIKTNAGRLIDEARAKWNE